MKLSNLRKAFCGHNKGGLIAVMIAIFVCIISQQSKAEEFVFELEKELKNGKIHKELKTKVEKRIQDIKNFLRSGNNKEEYDTLGVILHGYASLLKVFARATQKN